MSLSVLLGLCCGCLLAAEEPSADDLLREAIKLLNTRKAALKTAAEQKRIDDAAAALLELLKQDSGAATPASTLPLTTMHIRKKLRGKALYNPKTGELTVAYDFSNKSQLQDFKGDKATPVLARGMLALDVANSVTHCVKFKTLSLSAVVSVRQMKGSLVSTSGGVSVGVGGNHPDTLYLNSKGEGPIHVIVPAKERTGFISFGLQIEPRRLIAYWGSSKLGKPIPEPQAGHVQLHGGEMGYAFGSLVLKGQLDEDWAAEFFGLPK